MTALYSVAEIRAIEQSALATHPAHTLMARAAQAAAQFALALLPQNSDVLVLAGPGNNGGDAMEMAAHLAQAGLSVSILLFALAEKLPEDAKQAHLLAQRSPARFRDASPQAALAHLKAGNWAMVVDGLFGIGLSRPIAGDLKNLVEAVNTLTCPIFALDTPSGLDVDTGAVVGIEHGGVAIRATHTLTFIANKPGLHTKQGRDYAGQVRVASLDINTSHPPAPHCWLNDTAQFAIAITPRQHDSHKGSYGNVAILGGARGMSGAVLLAARTALQSGAGRVYATFLEDAPACDNIQPELMCRNADNFDLASAVLVVGPGLGQSRAAQDWLAQVLQVRQALVLDADALNLIAAEEALQQRLKNRRNSTLATLMTPHPLEAARLLGLSSQQVQADRLAAARTLARQFGTIVILKGSGSVIAKPDGEAFINPTGNPALATAGSGDVLAGLCGALLAQGWSARDAALGACWLHGAAADALVEQGTGPIGLGASELTPVIRHLLNRMTLAHSQKRGD